MNIYLVLFSFKGRIGRQTFWISILSIGAIIIIPTLVMHGHDENQANNYSEIMSLLLLWPILAIQVKRWHDRDKSAWWLLVYAVPIFGVIWALIDNGFLPGTDYENKYGKSST